MTECSSSRVPWVRERPSNDGMFQLVCRWVRERPSNDGIFDGQASGQRRRDSGPGGRPRSEQWTDHSSGRRGASTVSENFTIAFRLFHSAAVSSTVLEESMAKISSSWRATSGLNTSMLIS